MVRPLILVTCWRQYLPTLLGGRTVLDTLDAASVERANTIHHQIAGADHLQVTARARGGVIEAHEHAAVPTLAAAGSGPA